MSILKIAILGSGRGTSMQPIIDAIKNQELPALIELVISNKKDACILERAKKHGLKNVCITSKGKTRIEFDTEVMTLLDENQIDLVLLIGYMRFISSEFVDKWRGKVINTHPSLLPKFAGGMDLDVHTDVIKAGEEESGCTIHYVDDGADTGEIILQKKCLLNSDETPDSLKEKVQRLEGQAFIQVIKEWKK
jgi:phosphoribosylglycinamide formyltransferase 1